MNIGQRIFGGYEKNLAEQNVHLENTRQTRQPDSVNSQPDLAGLKEGSVFKGEILDIAGDKVTIALDGNIKLPARLQGDVALTVGDILLFSVKENNQSQVLIKPMFDSLYSAQTQALEKALDSAGLSPTEKNFTVAKELMEAGMPLDKGNMVKVLSQSLKFEGTSTQTLVAMNKLGIPVTEANITQYERYQNYSHQLASDIADTAEGMADFARAFPSGTDGNTLVSIAREVLDIILPESGQGGQAGAMGTGALQSFAIEEKPSEWQARQPDGKEAGELQQRNPAVPEREKDVLQNMRTDDSARHLIRESREEAAGWKGTAVNSEESGQEKPAVPATESGQENVTEPEREDGKGKMAVPAKESGQENVAAPAKEATQGSVPALVKTAGQEETAIQEKRNGQENASVKEEMTGEDTAAPARQTGNMPDTDGVGKQASPAIVPESDRVSKALFQGVEHTLQKAGLSAEQVKNLLQDSRSPEELLKQMTQALSSLNGNVAAIRTVMESAEYKKLFSDVVKNSWSIHPKSMKDPKEIDELYDKILKQSRAFEEAVASKGGETKQFGDNSQNMRQNMQFMEDLNHQLVYAQMPLKLSNQNANSELYVYADKRKLMGKKDGISVMLHLDMDYLGMTDIKVTLTGSNVNARFYLNDQDSVDIVAGNMKELAEQLKKRGFSLTDEVVKREPQQSVNQVVDEIIDENAERSIKRYTFDART